MFWENIKGYSTKDFKRLTGVEPRTFKLMVKEVKNHYEREKKRKGNNKGRPFKLSIENQVLMMLMYYREYRTQYHIGETYELHECNVGKNVKRIENILKKCKQFKLLGKEILAGSNHQYEVIIVDATESPIERPKKNNISIIQGKRRNIQ